MLGEGLLLLIGFAVQFAAHLEAKLQQEKLKKSTEYLLHCDMTLGVQPAFTSVNVNRCSIYYHDSKVPSNLKPPFYLPYPGVI